MVRDEVKINHYAYSHYAADYAKIYSNLELDHDYVRLFEGFAFLGGGTILDLGSGNGAKAKLLIAKESNVVCLDNSFEMLKLGGLDRSIQASIELIPFRDKTFDGILANCSLNHLPMTVLPDCLNEIKRVLKPKGALLVTMKLGQDTEGYFKEHDITRFQAFYRRETLDRILKESFNLHSNIEFSDDSKNLYTILCTAKN